ncbi:exo-beta-N-acetylmuramidase NamZ domain-containing protein [Anaeromyxobacter sp. Red801]|uniref:exo-beta-N-acetylmuramidase NamZ family protein n=1 Tax=Anaeromyxobacter sp. Red801 TaxID=3411632 RepID=UPI003BA1481F
MSPRRPPTPRKSPRAARRGAVRSGLDVLAARRFAPLRGRAVGLVCNPTAVTSGLVHAADLLHGARGVRLAALFGPEHGVRGDAQYMAAVEGERDPRTGVPVHSLYGATPESLKPRPEHLAGLDALVFDIQDVGTRFYTYQATMMLCMEAAAAARVAFVVLDRPNPIDGVRVEGPALRPGFESFCGLHDLAVRHGMTVGELALLFRAERRLDLELELVPCEGWRRGQRFRDTGLPWVFPSPNMPTPETALVYPGMCLLEGTNLSEGRGTTRPFELFGAPWLDGARLAADLARDRLPGVAFRPVSFVPTWDKHAGVRCHGVELHVTDPERFRPFRTGLACVVRARAQDPARFAWRTEPYEFVADVPAFDLLCGSGREREGIEAGASPAELARAFAPEERAFARRRSPFLRYRDLR